ncbi:AMP-binding protein [Streptomyces sp. NPDC050523]|uniref:AMP-binding protein n=1 Tax=Streptomyces sp. NPDC050523 TaxID=3365622 RepID=UPI00378DC765
MSEASPLVSINHPDRPRRAGSIGTPAKDVGARVLGEQGQDVPSGTVGELAVRGPGLMQSYWITFEPRSMLGLR